MFNNRAVLLTGATGLLGRYLLRDLVVSGRRVTVLARPTPQQRAEERIAELMARWSEQLGRKLPSPVVLAAELGAEGPGLARADERWLARSGHEVLHAAAHVGFRPTPDGEPWRTNVGGTQGLLRWCQKLGLARWHFISTAFVCGRRRGIIREHELRCGQQFHNVYEESKVQAERSVREAHGIHATIYRPSLVVGDSQTGYTSSYVGLYRFFELAARLLGGNAMGPTAAHPTASRALRLPLTGGELINLVPVDWVSRTIVELMSLPSGHGRTFHLVSRAPVPSRVIHAVARAELGLDGVVLAGPAGVVRPSALEEMFLGGVREYWPYLGSSARFCDANTAAALPHSLAPPMDGALLQRLIRFAVADGWGRRPRAGHGGDAACGESACAAYFTRTLPRQARASGLGRAVGLDVLIGFDIRGAGGGQWSCRWRRGEFAYAQRGLEAGAAAVYRTDVPTFQAIVAGDLPAQQAFFDQRIDILGDAETALKLTVLFEQFRENPSHIPRRLEAVDACIA